MAFARKVNTLVWDENASEWVPGREVILTKNSIACVAEPEGGVDKTAIRLNDGSTLRVNQTLDQILTFLNGA